MPKFLHVGCGDARADQTTIGIRHPQWTEVRLDIDPDSGADIVSSIDDMAAVGDGQFEALYSSHNIEHLYAHQVPKALAEFKRVLKPDGFFVITCPDLQSVAELIVADKLTEEVAPGSNCAAIDIVYGFRGYTADGNHYMAHHCGFTAKTLKMSLLLARFGSSTVIQRKAPYFDLWAVGTPERCDSAELDRLVRTYIPSTR